MPRSSRTRRSASTVSARPMRRVDNQARDERAGALQDISHLADRPRSADTLLPLAGQCATAGEIVGSRSPPRPPDQVRRRKADARVSRPRSGMPGPKEQTSAAAWTAFGDARRPIARSQSPPGRGGQRSGARTRRCLWPAQGRARAPTGVAIADARHRGVLGGWNGWGAGLMIFEPEAPWAAAPTRRVACRVSGRRGESHEMAHRRTSRHRDPPRARGQRAVVRERPGPRRWRQR